MSCSFASSESIFFNLGRPLSLRPAHGTLGTDECDVVRKCSVAVQYKAKSVDLVTELCPRR